MKTVMLFATLTFVGALSITHEALACDLYPRHLGTERDGCGVCRRQM
jgi:hypothetical protein